MRRVSTELPYFEEMQRGLKTHFGLDSFRPGQAECISAVISGRNTVVVMPTGAGKSLCYQLPALLLEGVTVVVSPLIALMKDQVDALVAHGIAATFINSTLTDSERLDRQRRMRGGEYKLVYVAPERFKSEAFTQALLDARLALYAIDEAHCISQWGHDFRPDYALLGQIRKKLRPARTVALTATATPEVREDVVRVLLLKEPQVYVAGFDRPNLFLEVVSVAGDAEKRTAIEALVPEGSGIVYCSTRKQVETLYSHLHAAKTPAVMYHAGMEDDARRKAQDTFMEQKGCVAVATNAFGMGIDKPDLRFVAHASIPRAVEAYYQEIGRAGRDGLDSRAVLLFNHADVFTQERLIQSNHPPDTLFADVWDVLRNLDSFDRGVHVLAAQVGASEFEVSAVLKTLDREGVLSRGGRGEGRYGITVLPTALLHQPRSAQAKSMLAALASSFPPGARGQIELGLLARKSGLDQDEARHALTLLERAGAITVQKPFAGRTLSVLRRDPWHALGLNLARLRAQERNQLLLLKRMTDYSYAKHCRRAFLLRYFGEEVPFGQSCGSCDVCVGAKLKLGKKAVLRPPGPTGAKVLPESYSVLAVEELKRWRKELSQDLGVPPFIIFNDATLYALAAALPTTHEEFLRVKGLGESRWERFGVKISQICVMARAAGDAPQTVASVGRARRR